MAIRPTIYLITFSLLLSVLASAQDINAMLNEARQLEVSFKESEALNKYMDVLRVQPGNFAALCKASELHSLLGKRQATKEKQKAYFKSAKSYAQQALRLNAASAEANFVMALAMGRMAIISSGEEKINAVKDIRTYAEKCVSIDPLNYKGYHILGRWHYEVSDLSSLEKWLVKVAYGSLPPASLKDAIAYYEKSRQLNTSLLINYLELAKCYHRKEEDKKAIDYLHQLLKLPNVLVDDPTVKAEARTLLKKWQGG
jgi:tetratricopeptide (TPR) repeat protein